MMAKSSKPKGALTGCPSNHSSEYLSVSEESLTERDKNSKKISEDKKAIDRDYSSMSRTTDETKKLLNQIRQKYPGTLSNSSSRDNTNAKSVASSTASQYTLLSKSRHWSSSSLIGLHNSNNPISLDYDWDYTDISTHAFVEKNFRFLTITPSSSQEDLKNLYPGQVDIEECSRPTWSDGEREFLIQVMATALASKAISTAKEDLVTLFNQYPYTMGRKVSGTRTDPAIWVPAKANLLTRLLEKRKKCASTRGGTLRTQTMEGRPTILKTNRERRISFDGNESHDIFKTSPSQQTAHTEVSETGLQGARKNTSDLSCRNPIHQQHSNTSQTASESWDDMGITNGESLSYVPSIRSSQLSVPSVISLTKAPATTDMTENRKCSEPQTMNSMSQNSDIGTSRLNTSHGHAENAPVLHRKHRRKRLENGVAESSIKSLSIDFQRDYVREISEHPSYIDRNYRICDIHIDSETDVTDDLKKVFVKDEDFTMASVSQIEPLQTNSDICLDFRRTDCKDNQKMDSRKTSDLGFGHCSKVQQTSEVDFAKTMSEFISYSQRRRRKSIAYAADTEAQRSSTGNLSYAVKDTKQNGRRKVKSGVTLGSRNTREDFTPYDPGICSVSDTANPKERQSKGFASVFGDIDCSHEERHGRPSRKNGHSSHRKQIKNKIECYNCRQPINNDHGSLPGESCQSDFCRSVSPDLKLRRKGSQLRLGLVLMKTSSSERRIKHSKKDASTILDF